MTTELLAFLIEPVEETMRLPAPTLAAGRPEKRVRHPRHMMRDLARGIFHHNGAFSARPSCGIFP